MLRLHSVVFCVILLFANTAEQVVARQDRPMRASNFGATSESLGVNIHFVEPVSGEITMIANAGFRWVRADLYWNKTEQQRGVYDFEEYDRLLESLESHHLRIVFILDYANPLYDGGVSPYTDEGRRAFAVWAKAAVSHFAGHGIIWEMYNEPDLTWTPSPDPTAYSKLALLVGQTAFADKPREIYVGPSLSGWIHTDFLTAPLQAGLLHFWSGIAVHPYAQREPENVAATYARLRTLMHEAGQSDADVPILCTEWGYSRLWSNTEGAQEAKYLPRAWIVNIANNVPITIWYDWRDDPPNVNPDEAAFGTVKRPEHVGQSPVFDPWPAYFAAKTATSMLSGYKYQKRLEVASARDFIFEFRKVDANSDDGTLLVAWTTGVGHSVMIPAIPGRYRVTSYMGTALSAVEASSSGLSVTVTDGPTYFMRD